MAADPATIPASPAPEPVSPATGRTLLSRRSALLLALTAAAVVAANLLLVRDARERAEEIRLSGADARAMAAGDALGSALRERDAWGAAYVATGNDRHRLRADRLGPVVRDRLALVDVPDQRPLIASLRTEVDRALARTDEAAALRRRGRRDAALARIAEDDARESASWEPLLARVREALARRQERLERQAQAEVRTTGRHALLWSAGTLALLLLGYVFLRRDHARLAALAEEDALTGLKNHRVFLERVGQAFLLSRRHETPLALLLVDVDHFKGYNDTFGHVVGDGALVKVAEILRRTARASDVVARPGGDEFAVLLPHTDGRQALQAAERLREALAQDPTPHRPLTLSVGIAFLRETMQTPEDLIQSADRALYRAKFAGGDISSFDD